MSQSYCTVLEKILQIFWKFDSSLQHLSWGLWCHGRAFPGTLWDRDLMVTLEFTMNLFMVNWLPGQQDNITVGAWLRTSLPDVPRYGRASWGLGRHYSCSTFRGLTLKTSIANARWGDGPASANPCPAGFRLASDEAIDPGMTPFDLTSALNSAPSMSARNPPGQISFEGQKELCFAKVTDSFSWCASA